MYQHILFATDLLETSYVIEEKLAAMQKLTDAKLSIIHVMEPLISAYPVGGGAVFYNFQEIQNTIEKNAKERLIKMKKRINISDTTVDVLTGSITLGILSYAKENDVDLIVTGSHGKHGLNLFLGSTANGILHGAKCDVLAVRINEANLESESYLKGLRDVYENNIRGQLDGVSREMEHLKFKASEFKEEVKMVYGQQAEHIRSMQATAKEKLDDLEEASADSWESLKEGVENTKDALAESLRNLKNKFH